MSTAVWQIVVGHPDDEPPTTSLIDISKIPQDVQHQILKEYSSSSVYDDVLNAGIPVVHEMAHGNLTDERLAELYDEVDRLRDIREKLWCAAEIQLDNDQGIPPEYRVEKILCVHIE